MSHLLDLIDRLVMFFVRRLVGHMSQEEVRARTLARYPNGIRYYRDAKTGALRCSES
jgi:hypothetical protein